ncbi:unnamed protein product [Haemonchus placei]|uniref:Uncharacterized protein n=1 Tax=Haemonchus placei TaxID=6290 RepID=A0A0N4W0A8_HAEPC|nr:unnamed protein product [Haemonchus placei]
MIQGTVTIGIGLIQILIHFEDSCIDRSMSESRREVGDCGQHPTKDEKAYSCC